MSKERNFFPGSNSGQGFYGRFDQIMPRSETKRRYLLKGGPGVGKSNFMRRVAEHLKEQVELTELFHCSSDPDSLDAVAFPELGLVLADATAPHTLDPAIPGAVDSIINLGDYLDTKSMTSNRMQIEHLLNDIKCCFERTYRYLGACALLRRDSEEAIISALDRLALARLIEELFESIFNGKSSKNVVEGKTTKNDCRFSKSSYNVAGDERQLFLEAITPVGRVSYLSGISISRTIALDAPWGLSSDLILSPLRDEALRLGFFVEGYYDPLDPKKLAHILIPELSVMVICGASDEIKTEGQVIPITTALNAELLAQEGAALRWNHHIYENLEGKAMECLHKEKALHDELENYYTTHMDFCRWQSAFDSIMNEINLLEAT